MKKHEVVTKENYREIVLKRAIISCWIILAICFVIKIFGGNFFNIVCNNENFIRFCDFIDKSIIRYILYFVLFMTESIVLLAIINPIENIKDKKLWIYLLLCLIAWIFKVLVEQNIIIINAVLDSIVLMTYLFLILTLSSKKPLLSILVVVYDTILGILSSIVKNINLNIFMTNSFLITSIFMIDFYIVLIMTSLYSKLIYIKKHKGG